MSDKESNPSLPIRLMQPEDVPGVIALYQSVYGDDYPVKTVYDADYIAAQQENGDMIRAVCINENGRVVGMCALYKSCLSNPALYEAGQGIVPPEFRQGNIFERLVNYLFDQVSISMGLEQIMGEAVCNHVISQKVCIDSGCYETGMEMDLMPAASFVREQSSQGRVSTLLLFKTFKLKNQVVYLPEIYQNEMRYLYSVYDFGHRFLLSQSPLPSAPTRGQSELFADAGLARFTITAAGSDLASYLVQQEEKALQQDTCIFQVYLDLTSPAVGAAVEILRQHQYFLGGILPRWFDSDGLLMQKVTHRPDFENIQLYTERAKKILALIKADYESLEG
ncbi:MAG TPA: hypothetical protein VN441_01505 [Syntrophomonas sp.]|nr:hypothetical protein [Syntrophomonas sp.]